MNRIEKSYPRIGERVLEHTLPNGLKLFVIPKPQYRRKYAFFAARYGGMDLCFTRAGRRVDTPAGIAHYLEHKMFDTKDGSAMVELSRNGAEPNAFTSNAMTGYYFDCTEHFEENLRLLLSFVSVPYFTAESVEKERGIIAQEIRMVEDSPDWQVYENLLKCLYHSSPARIPIAGTVESIADITAETLYDCHRAFYCPSNMALCVVGDVDPAEVVRAAREVPPPKRSCRAGAERRSAAATGRRTRALPARRAWCRWKSRCRSSLWASSAKRGRMIRCAGRSSARWRAISCLAIPRRSISGFMTEA